MRALELCELSFITGLVPFELLFPECFVDLREGWSAMWAAMPVASVNEDSNLPFYECDVGTTGNISWM
jgi:hypothetical protein